MPSPSPARTLVRRALLVSAGGAIGSAARLALALIVPEPAGIPLPVLIANVCGALLLGILAARLPASSEVRIFLGTGALGGFTTYSALAVGTAELWGQTPALAAGYAAGSVLLGLAAVVAGLRLGRGRRT
ncbi:fluoride efflux transporter FluC [Microbacterium sp. NPDC058345]|uniref:fluoride efflux transporter FluC n=1 Tax=Microbacterium sp. NPDC058345 TaxID=3346455 RepID=UPI003654C79A